MQYVNLFVVFEELWTTTEGRQTIFDVSKSCVIMYKLGHVEKKSDCVTSKMSKDY